MAEALDPRWAWDTYQPSQKEPWDVRKVGHLYRRATFGATLPELEAALQDGPENTIGRLLRGGPGQEKFDEQMAEMAKSISRVNNPQQLRAWWLYRMVFSAHPLREKLTLFWH